MEAKKKTVISRVFKVIGFTALIAAIIVGASFGFNIAGDNSTRSYEQRQIFREKDNTIDVLVLGNSGVHAGVSPMEMYAEYGFTSYDCSQSLQLPWESYQFLAETIEHQNLKVLALEVDQFFSTSRQRNRYGKLREYGIRAFPLYETHLGWKSIGEKNVRSVTKGYIYTYVKVPAKGNVFRQPTEEKYKMQSDSERYLKKIYDLCEDKGIELMLFEVPSANGRWDNRKHNTITEFAQAHELNFVDMNDRIEELGLDWKYDTRDKGDHLNYNGAVKVSKWLGKFLSENYGLESRKGNPRYAHWDEDYAEYAKLVGRKSDGKKN